MEKVKVNNISKAFKTDDEVIKVLHKVNFSIQEKEFLCLIGPSGCGKTTLLKIIAGLENPSEGSVEIDENAINESKDQFGFVFQSYSLYPWRTVLDNVLFGLELKGIPLTQRQSRAQELIELVGLSKFANYYPAQLSGGMQKFVSIARALAPNPSILLCDEPFANVDAQSRNLLQEELLRIWKKTNKTIIFVTHNVDEAVFLAERILVLTARPATIKSHYQVDIPYPRDRTSTSLVKIRHRILEDLKTEISLPMGSNH